MWFEFDPAKSASNKSKHGIDFVEAQALWLDAMLIHIPARLDGEARVLSIGKIDGRHWSAIWTQRGEKVRLISVRRARQEEVAIYEDSRV